MAAKHFDLFSLIFTAHISRQKQSIAPVRPKADWAIDSEAMRARGIIICFSKIQLVGQKNIETKHLSRVKARHQSFFTAKTLQIWRALFATSGL